MSTPTTPFVFLPGSGGGVPDLSFLSTSPDHATRFEPIDYPGWQRYVDGDFSPQVLIAELAGEIQARVPRGPIRIMGVSMGGHFGYAVALHLQALGREIAGFCAIDAFMINTAEPTTGWQSRALAGALELLRHRRLGEFSEYARSKFWRAWLRLAGGRLNQFCASGWLPRLATLDPVLARELRLRLFVRAVAPWLASLDVDPVALKVPSILLRTPLTAGDDEAWRRRCPNIRTYPLTGQHHTLFEAENAEALRNAFIAATSEWC